MTDVADEMDRTRTEIWDQNNLEMFQRVYSGLIEKGIDPRTYNLLIRHKGKKFTDYAEEEFRKEYIEHNLSPMKLLRLRETGFLRESKFTKMINYTNFRNTNVEDNVNI